MRESAAQKARRYLTEGRLTVLEVSPGRVRAVCRGGGRFYKQGYADGQWGCDCPALTTCAHLHALQLVTAPALEREAV